eukprot:2694487-Rhodomonas_salina.3
MESLMLQTLGPLIHARCKMPSGCKEVRNLRAVQPLSVPDIAQQTRMIGGKVRHARKAQA